MKYVGVLGLYKLPGHECAFMNEIENTVCVSVCAVFSARRALCDPDPTAVVNLKTTWGDKKNTKSKPPSRCVPCLCVFTVQCVNEP